MRGFITPLLQMGKLRPSEVMLLFLGHREESTQGQGSMATGLDKVTPPIQVLAPTPPQASPEQLIGFSVINSLKEKLNNTGRGRCFFRFEGL